MPTVTRLLAHGDSITAGIGGVDSYASATDGVAFNWGGATLDNRAVSGACLQTVTGQYAIYDNYEDTIGATTADAAIFAWGFNDARYNGADTSVNLTNFINLYRSAMRRAVVKLDGAENITIVTLWYISDTALATGGQPDFQGRTRAHFETYVNAAIDIANEFGAWRYNPYALGKPATTLDGIHPDQVARDDAVPDFGNTVSDGLRVRTPDAPSTNGPTNPTDYTIRVPAGCTCYLIEGNTETLLPAGDHVTYPGNNELMWTDGGGYVRTSMNVSGDQTALNVTPVDNVGCTVNSATPESIDLTCTSARCHYTYDWSSVAQNEIVFMQITAAGLPILVRENTALTLDSGTGNNTIFNATVNGTVTIRAPRTTTSPYFGFIKNPGTAGSFQVKFFKVGVTDQTKLNSIPADVSNFVINSWSQNSLSVTGLTTANTYAFDYTAVQIGEPIKFDITTSGDIRVIIREASTTDFLTGATTLYDQTINGSASLELERTTTAQYFGFRLLNAGDFDVTNFQVGNPVINPPTDGTLVIENSIKEAFKKTLITTFTPTFRKQ